MPDAHGSGSRHPLTLLERLEKHPRLKARIEAMLEVVENADGDVGKADESVYSDKNGAGQCEILFLQQFRFKVVVRMPNFSRRTP